MNLSGKKTDNEILEWLMKESGMNKTELAKRVETNRSYIYSLLETETFSNTMRKRLTEAFGLKVNPFVAAESTPNSAEQVELNQALLEAMQALKVALVSKDELIDSYKFQVKVYRNAVLEAQKQGFKVNDMHLPYNIEQPSKEDDNA